MIDDATRQRALAWVARNQHAEVVPGAVALAYALCVRFEGLALRPYICPAGVPTIGYGATYYESGRRVTMKDAPISRARAEQLLEWMLRAEFLPAARRLCPRVTDPRLLAVLLSFTFNLGAGRLATSTLRRRINAGLLDDVPHELRKWVKGRGRTLRGLVRRREAEIVLLGS